VDGTGLKVKNKTLFSVIRWFFGIIFILSSAIYFSSSFIVGLIYFLAAIVSIPPTAKQLENKLNVNISGSARFIVVFLLLIFASAAMPHTNISPVNNSTTAIASHPSSLGGSDAIAVPSEPTHVAPSSPTPTPEVTPIPEVTSTPTPEDKGKLNIITNPTDATVTIDGVSEGKTPINDLSIDAGTHNIDMYLSGYNPHKETVNLANSETKTILWSFVPETSRSSTPASTPDPTVTPKQEATPVTTSKSTATSTTTKSTATPTTTSQTNSIVTDSSLVYGNSNTHVYHAAGCYEIQKMNPDHIVTFKSRADAEAASYRPCKKCGG
jgi:hypothetical protein